MTLFLSSVLLVSAPKASFTVHDKAYYSDPGLVAFVRPGLVVKITTAKIAADGTITAEFTLADPKGLPLDRTGVFTPGPVTTSFLVASIPAGQTQFVSYITRLEKDATTGATATQATSDSGGVYTSLADGKYRYTFHTKAPASYEQNATHRIGVYSSRNLTEFELGTQFADNVYTFVPNGTTVSNVRDVVRTDTCNRCHDPLSAHGGARKSVELCIMCHTPQTTDANSGNTVDFKVMVHKIHAGEELPSVQAGKPYQIIGFRNSVNDFSSVVFPADVRNCQVCHDQNSGAKQAANFLNASQAACGSCHDNVNFATGENHVDLPQVNDKQCGSCHTPQGELEFDASIIGAHTIPQHSLTLPGVVVQVLKVDNGAAGKKPTVTFSLRDAAGKAIALKDMNRVALVLAGSTVDYGSADFGVSTPGYVSEDATKGTCDASGTCTYTFLHAIPATATGTYSVGIEARRAATLLPGTKKQVTTQYGAINHVMNFSVDSSPVQARRTVVSIDNCNQCHSSLSLHGANRNQIEQCVLCHNPNESDKARRPAAEGAPQAINFAQMIHKIHTGEELKAEGGSLIVYGFGGSKNDFSEVRFPGDRRNCATCHVNASEQLPLEEALLPVKDARGLINPVGATTSACTGCHVSRSAASHALANTSTLGESCAVCHGPEAEFSINKVHAR
jgi:OmcA/MtrC family decaheme c-type cytochrome